MIETGIDSDDRLLDVGVLTRGIASLMFTVTPSQYDIHSADIPI